MKNSVNEVAKEFSSGPHGSTDLFNEKIFVQGSGANEFVPFSYLLKKLPETQSIQYLQSQGFVLSSLDFLEPAGFDQWWQSQFNKKLLQKDRKTITIIHHPDAGKIFEAVEIVDQVYSILKDHQVLINGKNLPIQLGEFYAKVILGLVQKKSASQRGFDFFLGQKKVEVKVHWHDVTSLKGVKLKKSLVDLSDYVVVVYLAKNFRIRDILLLDSDFVKRKFSGKGHTLFLKDGDVSNYFFSKSNKHYEKIANMPSLMKFATPNFAIKIDEKLASDK